MKTKFTMTLMSALALTMVVLPQAQARGLQTYECAQNAQDGHRSWEHTSVVVQELAELEADEGYDAARKVRISVTRREYGTVAERQTFFAKALMEDVSYEITSKSQKIKFWMYMDEYDQSGFQYVDQEGNPRKVSLICWVK